MSEKEQKVVSRSGPWWAVVSRSRAGQIYYFNCKTGEKSWNKPPSFDTNLPGEKATSSTEEQSTQSGNRLKIKTSPAKKLRNNNAGAPYSKRQSEDTGPKADFKKQAKERRNLGSFEHTFHPPAKPSIDTTPEEEKSQARVAATTSLSSASPRVSLNIKNKKSPRAAPAPDNVFSKEEIENKSDDPSVTSSPALCRDSSVRTWLKDVPFGILNSATLLENHALNRYQPDCPLYSANRQEQDPKNRAEPNPAMRNCVRSNSGKVQRLRDGAVARLVTDGPYQAPGTRRRSGGLGEERMRKLREQLTEEVQRKEEEGDKEKSSQGLSHDEPAKRAKKRGLLPTPPSYMKIDLDSNFKKDIEEPSTNRVLMPASPGVVRLDNSVNFRKDIENFPTKTTRKGTLKNMKIDSNSNITKEVLPDVCRQEEKLTNSIVDNSLNFLLEVPVSDVIPAAEVFESEAMDVDEEAQVLSDIKALRTAGTWESFDPEWTPMEVEIVGVSSDIPSTAVIVLDTNILLSHLSFVQELRDTLKLNGDHPFLYLPWMVFQELDRLKEGSSKRAILARAAVSFLNDSFKRKHPRIRGQTGREANRARSGHVEELYPDDSILESCLQLQEQGLHTLLLSNDVSLCNKALIHNIEAVTKIQLTNEMRNAAETNSLLYTGQTPPPEKKVNVMDRLRSLRQPTEPQPYQSQPVQRQSVKPQSTQIETEKTTSELEGLKKNLLDTFSKVLSTGMEAEYGSLWTKRVLYKPPWELHNVFVCIAKHWFAICDNTTPEPVQKAANELRKIFQKSVNNDSIDQIINLTREISSRLPFKYGKIICPLEKVIQTFFSGRNNQNSNQNCQATESQSGISAEQPNVPSVDSIVLAYFGSLWNILHPFCNNLKEKLDNGIAPDSDTRTLCKEMLNGTEELVKNIQGVLSVPENELDIRHPGLQGLLDILRSTTPPPGAKPLQLEHIYTFCVQPKERVLLFNGLSQLEECGNVLVSALKSGNNLLFY